MKIQNIDVPFAQIPNAVLFDERLSWKAKGLFAYIQAKPNDWDFATARMANEADGIDSTRAGLIELEEKGYLKRSKQADGRVKFRLCIGNNQLLQPELEIPSVGKSLHGETPPIINKEIHTNKEKEIKKEATDEQLQDDLDLTPPKKKQPKKEKKTVEYVSDHKEISQIIHAMVAVDPKNKLYYANTTQKRACDFLIQEYGLEKVLELIAGLPKARLVISHFPSVTTPCELRDKWVKIHEAVHRMTKSKKPDREVV